MRDGGPLKVTGYETEYVEAAGPPAPSYQPARVEEPLSRAPLAQERPAPAPYATPAPPIAPAQAAPPTMTDAQLSAVGRGRFVWPVHGDIVSGFGASALGRRNDGVDIRAAEGSSVKAAAPGEVIYAGDQVPGYGNMVLLEHPGGWVTAYAHLDKVDVQMKQQVVQGQELGSVGVSGGLTEPELHFEVRYAATPTEKHRPVDPVLVLPAS